MTDYTFAPSTLLLATHCIACGRPLRDAVSVESGIGPICAEKYGFFGECSAEGRAEANSLIHQCAARQREGWAVIAPLVARLRELGWEGIADKIERRLKKGESETPDIFVTECSLNGWPWYKVITPFDRGAVAEFKTIPGRWFTTVKEGDKEVPVNMVPKKQRAALWALLRNHYAGKVGESLKGLFVIPS
jgi:hypothetical protein